MTNYKLFFIFISLFASLLISFEPIKYVDEILAVISFFYILSNRKNLLPQEKKIIWCLFLLLFVLFNVPPMIHSSYLIIKLCAKIRFFTCIET